MVWFTIYLLVSIEKIAALFLMSGGVILTISLLTVLFAFIALVSHCEVGVDLSEFCKKYYPKKTVISLLIFCSIFYSIGKILPSQQEMAIIVGSGAAYEVLTSPEAKKLGNKALDALNKKLDDVLKEGGDNPSVEKPVVAEKPVPAQST
jgi:hypothetical protein